jgi:hypothetical protein
MAGLTVNRNPPFSPFSVNSVTEILLSPFRGEVVFGGGFSGRNAGLVEGGGEHA